MERQPKIFNFITWREINDIHEFDIPKTGKICTEIEDFTVLMEDFSMIFAFGLHFDHKL